ncbi:spore coat protein [uncultured Negativibacillus sp.]|uniref:spore coat protein n=1 Tax=uncultured Negativibacillus sp. TaxID=1980696 RepID=UPI0025D572E4|nr:spore coat protein [uncultured Negativibacillus sp.]
MNLTTKELTAIEEQLGQEELLIQKFKMYAEMTQDQQLKSSCQQIAAKHEIHKSKLLNLLS